MKAQRAQGTLEKPFVLFVPCRGFYSFEASELFPAAEIEAQRRIRQMRVIVLWSWAND